MSDLYTMKNKCILNGIGLYSQEQVDELERRGDDLWKALNYVYAGLRTYVYALECELDHELKNKNNIVIRNALDKLNEMTDKTNDALFNN